MVLMGINRIVVTSGKIAAKVNYKFQARDKYQASAQDFDYKRYGTQYSSQEEYASGDKDADYEEGKVTRGASYWSKGQYRNAQQPYVKVTNITASQTDAQLQASASMAGEVNVQFKSETLPLERMADQLVEKVINIFPFKGIVVFRKRDSIAIDLGQCDGVKSGMHFAVFKEHKVIRCPETMRVIDCNRIQTGVFKIQDVKDKISTASILAEKFPGAIANGQMVESAEKLLVPEECR